ncbi:MAG: SCO family protein [Archangium sp.]
MQRAIAIVLALGMSASLAALLLARQRNHGTDDPTAEDFAHTGDSKLPPMWPSPDFAFRSQTGETVTKGALLGTPYVANFIFTTCRTVCPLLTAKMVRVQRELGPDAKVRFVSFSVDPGNDTVEKLAEYQKQWNPDEKRWSLLETTQAGLDDVARGFHVTAQRTDGGLDAVMHSAVFLLVDANGVVRGAYDSEDPEDFKKLLAKTRGLLGTNNAAPEKKERSGEVLFHELSCSNCHERPELAPPLGGLIGQRRELETRLLVTADEAYVKESILAPDAKRVAGYPLHMPSYAGHVTNEELNSLYVYVSALPAPAAAPSAEVAVDPVCHMKVRVTPDALKIDDHYFCSAWCRDRFKENPDAYRR